MNSTQTEELYVILADIQLVALRINFCRKDPKRVRLDSARLRYHVHKAFTQLGLDQDKFREIVLEKMRSYL